MNHLKYFGNSIYKYRNLSTNINCILFNWNGTLIDPYSIGITKTLSDVFRINGIIMTPSLVRQYLGLNIDLHISNILSETEINNKWVTFYKDKPTLQNINELVKKYEKIYENNINYYCDIIPNVKEIFDIIKKNNISIGITTNVSNNINNIIVKKLETNNIKLDNIVCSEDINNSSRPNPFMIYENMKNLNIQTINSVIKVDNNIYGIKEGINAGCWTVGIYKYSSYNIIYDNEMININEKEKKLIEDKTKNKLINAGADFVIPDITYLPEIIEKINTKMEVNRVFI
jgi:phosphonoacetaldehyde hydrolase